MVTDWSRCILNSSVAGDLDLSDKRDTSEVGMELIDKLSMAAGVTAKDKRNKDKTNAGIQMQKIFKKGTDGEAGSSKLGSGAHSGLGLSSGSSHSSSYVLVHDSLGSTSGLPNSLTVAQVMACLRHEGNAPASHITLTLSNRREQNRGKMGDSEHINEAMLLCTEPLPSTLHVFTSQGGLSLLAQHMSLLYPDTGQQHSSSTGSVRSGNGEKGETVVDNDWVSVEMNDYESAGNVFDYLVMGGGSGGSPGPVGGGTVSLLTLPSIPPHALGAFTLFLRLPGYAETLLKDTHKACCLLRLALGVTDDGDGGDIVDSGVGGYLATLPFQVLESLLEATPLTTDDGLLLRRMCLESGALHLILACLAALSHQDTPEVVTSLYHQNVPIGLVVATTRATCVDSRSGYLGVSRGEGDRCHYWAKGTGFGTGSTTQSWDVEQALVRQKVEEEHVVWLVRLLAQYINPGDVLPSELESALKARAENSPENSFKDSCDPPLPPVSPTEQPSLPPALLQLFQNSGLITTIASNLSNDSVLDMSRHVPLYRALLALVRGLSVTSSLAPLLLTSNNTQSSSNTQNSVEVVLPCIPSLLQKMKKTVNTYMAKLRWKSSKIGQPTNSNSSSTNVNSSDVPSGTTNNDAVSQANKEEMEQEEGLSLIVPDIQNTALVVKCCTERLQEEADAQDTLDSGATSAVQSTQSLMETYLNTLKPMQFDTYEMVVEDTERGIRFVVSHHYEGSVRGAGDLCTPRRMKRLAQEAVTLSTSLPLSYSSSVFVRTDLDRLDIMKVLIMGPEDTPYANGCFEFDVYFPVDYPTSPLHINLQTTGEGRVRFNPNLYQDGKVCLSILNTWHGRPEEKWNPQTSSLLQVLVSIQSLIFVSEPYFNEPGYERSRGTPAAMQNSREYDANIRAASVRWAMLNQMRNPSPCFKDVIERHFWLKHKEVIEQVEGWIADMETLSENRRSLKNIAHNTIGLKKNVQLLKEELRKMTAPPGLESFPLCPSLLHPGMRGSPHRADPLSSGGSPSEKRDIAQEEGDKEARGASAGTTQAGPGPVRHRIRKPSRANLLGPKPVGDLGKRSSTHDTTPGISVPGKDITNPMTASSISTHNSKSSSNCLMSSLSASCAEPLQTLATSAEAVVAAATGVVFEKELKGDTEQSSDASVNIALKSCIANSTDIDDILDSKESTECDVGSLFNHINHKSSLEVNSQPSSSDSSESAQSNSTGMSC